MAVNNDCPDCQKSYGQQASNSSDSQDSNALYRTRTASPVDGRSSPTIYNPYYTGRPRTPANGTKSSTIDRQEIIKRIKSRESRPTSPELERSSSRDGQDASRRLRNGPSRTTSPEIEKSLSSGFSRKRKSPGPRPSTPNAALLRPRPPTAQPDNELIGLQIERPRSALHRGDFREREQTGNSETNSSSQWSNNVVPILSTSPVAPWHPAFPTVLERNEFHTSNLGLMQNRISVPSIARRDRGISSASLASTFTYKPPTSPLVQSSRPDTPDMSTRERSRSPDKSRRHTFSPQSVMDFQSALDYPTSPRTHKAPPTLRSEKTFPYQAHQPRRSLNSFNSAPQSPLSAASRRPSLSGDSPLHHAPLVGSYEESILRGRMSTVPSRPLNFMAQIGVLGKGDCKANLRCPPHASIGFPAVFYSYGSGLKNSTNDQPSPYVGLIDLESNLANQQDVQTRRRQRLQDVRSAAGSRTNSPDRLMDDEMTSDAHARRRRRQKAKRRSGSPKAPPGGSYRIPQQGQLQIVIKNPNKTAVKLFLVPYDLSDMEPGQKTFIRQRSYSAGPVIDMPLSSRRNFGTDRPEAALSATDDPNDRPVLRYLIHIHICCPSKGRYFLYKSIRVVFANRVPDGKEKLRNEIQLPEPRYSTYKASRDSNVQVGTLDPLDNNLRRRSAARSNTFADTTWPVAARHLAQSLPAHEYSTQQGISTPTLPRHFTILPTLESRPASRHFSDGMDESISPSTPSMRSSMSSEGDTPHRNIPQLQDPFSFERDRSRERRVGGRNESLLSRRLMDLAFQNQNQGIGNDREED